MKTFLEDIRAGERERVSKALAQDPSLARARDPQGVSAILLATYSGQHEIADELIASGVELDVFEAAATGRRECLVDRLDADPEATRKTSPDGFSALGLATFFGRRELLPILLERGADPAAPSDNPLRVAPLHSAVAHRDDAVALEMSRLLLSAGAQVNAAQAGGWTPLHQAAAHGHLALVRLLLEHGADPALTSDDGRTPRAMAEERGHDEVLPLLDRA